MQASFFEWLETHGAEDLPTAIAESCRIKAAVVGEDEREQKDRRALLNFGHSFGHALEAECGYDGTLLHGEAVAIGMVLAARLSFTLGLCEEQVPLRIEALLKKLGLPTSPLEIRSNWDVEALIARMKQDKKVKDGKIQLILLKNMGEAIVTSLATEEDLRHLWKYST